LFGEFIDIFVFHPRY